jgi:hypothetical protein
LAYLFASLWCRPLPQALRERAATAWAVGWLTGAAPQAWAVEPQRAKQRVHHDLVLPLASAPCAATRAGLLSRIVAGCLLRNHRLLHASQDRLALGQGQTEGRLGQRLPFKADHLCHDLLSFLWLDHELHGELHAHASVSDVTIGIVNLSI